MFGRGLGGIEKAFCDYSECLANEGHEVVSLIHPEAAIRPIGKTIAIGNMGEWDLLASLRIRALLRRLAPDVIITHGNRASRLVKRARGKIPAVTVLHNYNIKNLSGFSAVIAVSEHIRQKAVDSGFPASRAFFVPNMIKMPLAPPARFFRSPPIIGGMGRFVTKKGFDVFIKSLALLESEGVEFKAVLGGGGEESEKLASLAAPLRNLELAGWVEDKKKFFDSIDIFCLPSLSEPFGIVLLEAFASAVPVVTTDCDGPAEICANGMDSLIVPKADEKALARALKQLLTDPVYAKKLGDNGYKKASSVYEMSIVGKTLSKVLCGL